jgi:hypothetical protein
VDKSLGQVSRYGRVRILALRTVPLEVRFPPKRAVRPSQRRVTRERRVSTSNPRPRLVYDRDCGYCGYRIPHRKGLTSVNVEYRRYQEVAAQYSTIFRADFDHAVQFITPDGHHASALRFSRLLERLLENEPMQLKGD